MSIERPAGSMSEAPSWWRSGLNYIAALARYAAAGCPNVSEPVYVERLRICAECPLCRQGKCLICTCDVVSKAQMGTEKCPRDPPRWLEISCKK
jgi:hypothetical protein